MSDTLLVECQDVFRSGPQFEQLLGCNSYSGWQMPLQLGRKVFSCYVETGYG